MSSISNNIKTLRLRYGFTQDQVASIIGISRESLSYYETGARPVPVKFLDSFADLFGVDIEQLVEEYPEEVLLTISFRSIGANEDDIKEITAFKRVVRNYLKLKSLANARQK